MRIGILSLTLHTNYGGIMQSYALQTILENMGHTVIILDKDRNLYKGRLRQSLSYLKYILLKYVFRKDVIYYNLRKLDMQRREREQYTQRFINKYLHRRIIRNIRPGVFNDVDAIVVGSDQVWRPLYFVDQWQIGIEQAYLQFAASYNIKRIAYAPSFGSDEWEYSEEDTKKCMKLLQKFNSVSVRESSAINLCQKNLSRKDVKQVLDPTLLLSKKDYISIIENANPDKSLGNMLCYILDYSDEKSTFVKMVAKERHLEPFYSNSQVENNLAPQEKRIQPPLEQWLRGFMDAKFVVTDSFHACVFSIIFEKPFVAIANKERGMTRFESFLSMFSLEKNLLYSINDYDSSCTYEISPRVKKMIKEYRETSIEFLQKSLQNE